MKDEYIPAYIKFNGDYSKIFEVLGKINELNHEMQQLTHNLMMLIDYHEPIEVEVKTAAHLGQPK